MRALLILMLAGPLAAQMASVQGTVTELSSGRPVRNAEVRLRGITQTGNPPETDNYIAETGANGRFLIEGIVPGKYEAGATHAGFVTLVPGKPRQPGTFSQFTLAAGAHSTVDLKLIGAGVISGRVANVNGDPVSGAYVELAQYAYPNRNEPGSSTVPADGRKQLQRGVGTIADDRGEFRLHGLAPGQYYLRVAEITQREGALDCGWAAMLFQNGFERVEYFNNGAMQCTPAQTIRGPRPPTAFAMTYYPGTPDFSHATPLDVTAGGELRNIEIRLHPQSVYSIRGTAPQSRGGIAWELHRRGDANQPNYVAWLLDLDMLGGFHSMNTDGDNFQITGLLPGSYILSANLQDPERGDEVSYARQLVEIVDRDVDGVALSFAPMKSVTGTVKSEGPLTVPFSGMNVELDPDNSESSTSATRVNADGTFTIQVLPESYTLMRPRIAVAYIKSVKMGGRELTGPHIDFSRADGPLTILFGVDAGKVEGTALDANGKPVLPVRVTLIPAGADPDWPGRLRIVNTDEAGKFVFPMVAPGEYKLFAWSDADLGAPQDPDFRKAYESQGVTVKVEPNGHTTAALTVIVTR